MKRRIRIGTRDSELALWQAVKVENSLKNLGFDVELVPVKSTGDLILDKPLYELGITGIFTKTLDIAMLNGTIDIAVHSMKDVPTVLPDGIVQAAVLERGASEDVLIASGQMDHSSATTIATGSLRRRAQWLNRYPHHKVVGLRGNVNTRLKKLEASDWDGAIFAKAGLERIGLLPVNHEVLDWMIPAPAQGAMVVVANENDPFCREAVAQLNHKASELCTSIEREFLRILEGGCSAPIGASARIEGEKVLFNGILLSLDGKTRLEVERTAPITGTEDFGRQCALQILANGGAELMKQIRGSV